ncbi:sulfotransferase [Xanthomarina gelatinilytica]|uniref:sulfotransferase n=1 Tax=Xanthomarina gelatinilytica TaxID=1137281 RepID=UPI003AA7C774
MKEKKSLDKPIIIVGFGRSGTSIISDIILSHSKLGITSNYNLKYPRSIYINLLRNFFDNELFYIQGQKNQLNSVSILNKYTFRNVEAYRFWENLTGFDLGRNFLNETDVPIERLNYVREQLVKLLIFQRKERLGFKITGPSRLRFFNQIFPDAYYIYVKRDPVANIKSFIEVDFNRYRKNNLWWKGKGVYTDEEINFVAQNQNQPELIAALQYYKVGIYHNIEANKFNMQSRIIDINYEDFVENPNEEILKITDFVELTLDKRIKKFLMKNPIYNRNVTSVNYFSNDVEQNVRRIANNGIS